MGFIIEGFLGLALLLGGAWLALFVRVKKEADRAAAKEAQVRERERLLQVPNERLLCVACDLLFPGPLTGDGCPQCHSGAFVIPRRLHDGPTKTATTLPVASPLPEVTPAATTAPETAQTVTIQPLSDK